MYNFDMFNKKLQEGYEEFYRNNEQKACRIWKATWKIFLNLVDSTGIKSIEEFDNRFRETEFASNWVQDYEQALGNAARDDSAFYQERINYCEEFLHKFESSSDKLIVQNTKRAIGESYFILGQRDTAESLFEKWLEEDPKWGWGWIGWADCWAFFTSKEKGDLEKATGILYKGLEIKDVCDKEYMYERLVDLYRNMGMMELADTLDEMRRDHIKYEEMRKEHEKIMAGFSPNPQKQKVQAVSVKIGRNEACPCGSGKKYKKCCGR